MKLCALMISTLLLLGCATPLADQRRSLAGVKPCCSSVGQLSFKALALNAETTAVLGPSSQVFAFPSGNSYTAAFDLAVGKSRGMQIASEFNGQLIGQYFQPIVVFLDAQKAPIASATPSLRFVAPALIPYTVAHMAGGVRVPDEAAHAVIFTRDFSDTTVSAAIPGSPNVVMAGQTPIVVSNPATNKSLELSPTGELRLKLVLIPQP